MAYNFSDITEHEFGIIMQALRAHAHRCRVFAFQGGKTPLMAKQAKVADDEQRATEAIMQRLQAQRNAQVQK